MSDKRLTGPGILLCPVCACPVCACPTQRTLHGTPLEGLRAHQEAVHPDKLTVVRVTAVDEPQEAL